MIVCGSGVYIGTQLDVYLNECGMLIRIDMKVYTFGAG